MDAPQLLLEYLKLFVSWPVAVVVIVLILRRELPRLMDQLAQRIKRAEIAGNTFEFSDTLVQQSQMTKVIEKIQETEPKLVQESLHAAGLEPEAFNQYRDNIRRIVTEAQRTLLKLGYDLGRGGPDGVAGPQTAKAVRQFQLDQNLMVDGRIGPKTLARLRELG